MKTPNDLFSTFAELGNTARQNIVELMKSHHIKSLNTKVYMYDYGYDYVDISAYNRKMECMFFEPISMITLDEQDNIHIFYDGEESGECQYPTTTDWLNVYSLVYDIFEDVDSNNIDLFTDSEEQFDSRIENNNYFFDIAVRKIWWFEIKALYLY